MSGTEETAGRAIGSKHIGLLVFAILMVLFALIPGTRPLVFVVLWAVAPVAAFGTLLQVVRGSAELRSGKGLIFAMWCAATAALAIPFGVLVSAPGVGESITFLGVLGALLAIGIARLAVTDPTEPTQRDIPPELAFDENAPVTVDDSTHDSE